MQDIYRRTLAASWTSRAGDLPADKLVEELFSGSSCWNNQIHDASPKNISQDRSGDPALEADANGRQARSGKRLSPSFERRPKSSSSNNSHSRGKAPDSLSNLGHPKNAGSIGQQLFDATKGRGWKTRNADHELSEFDVRDDLRSWEVAAKD